jgi:O-acetyl-ADP-ribose deacetylase (regulator of RNase III)
MAQLEVVDGDITTLDVDAIANAANTQLLHGGGVAAVIERAGGEVVRLQSRERAPIALGEAVATGGGDLPAMWVIHAATMELGGPTSADVIRRCSAATVRVAEELGCRSLGLVAFGAGVGAFPLDDVAEIMVGEVRATADTLERVVFCTHGPEATAAFERAVGA